MSKNEELTLPRAAQRALAQPTVDSIDLGNVLGRLADPTRLLLMRRLHQQLGPVDCSRLVDNVPVSAPTISHHWRVLREAGLTSTFVDGRSRIVVIRYEDLETRFPGLLTAILNADSPAKPA